MASRLKGLRQMVTLLRDVNDEFVRFDFEPADRQSAVFGRCTIEAATKEILAGNGIRTKASPALLAIRQAKSKTRRPPNSPDGLIPCQRSSRREFALIGSDPADARQGVLGLPGAADFFFRTNNRASKAKRSGPA
jgi:hypothetical protein